jgi:hypothetical protein
MANWKENIPSASDDQEAKWNFAFWLQNIEYQFGTCESDKKLIKEWIIENNLYYSDEDEEKDFDQCLELGEKIERNFVTLSVEVAAKIQKKILPSISKKPIPVLVHELEYYDEIAEQNKRINSNGEADEFIKWISDF